jgi:hypothetical protein
MRNIVNTPYRNYLFALIPTLTSIFFGLVFVWQQGVSSTSLSFVFLMVLFSLVSGYFMWVWHTDQLTEQNEYHQQRYLEGINSLKSYILELERMMLTIEPKLTEQVVAAKELTEIEVSTLLRRFLVIREELKLVFGSAHQSDANPETINLDTLSLSAEKIHKEIDSILESLQFQDRVSQILALVMDNLITLSQTLETVQQQGSGRHQKLLRVDDMLTNIQTQYDTVKHQHNRSKSKKTTEEVTFF